MIEASAPRRRWLSSVYAVWKSVRRAFSHSRDSDDQPLREGSAPCLLLRLTKKTSELAEVKASRPFPYNEHPRKSVTAIRTLSIDGADTCFTLPVRRHYFQVPFTFRATAD